MKRILAPRYEAHILSVTGASGVAAVTQIQELWSGYGQILKVALTPDGNRSGVIAKHVRFPKENTHPRGWQGERSHARKVRSYEVESRWYRDWSQACGPRCRVPVFLTDDRDGDELLLVMEDLDLAGFPRRIQNVRSEHVRLCLQWLAGFHATFLNEIPEGLWKIGTYWHLETRPEEWAALDDLELKRAASALDERLSSARFQTFVHGDAKLANFCFSEAGDAVAAVDFQYVGGGCGMKDVAYFLGSCLDEKSCEEREDELLECYFGYLEEALAEIAPTVDGNAVIAEWRGLYRLAWADFHRFLKGWSPDHWKLTDYSERVVREVLAGLRSE